MLTNASAASTELGGAPPKLNEEAARLWAVTSTRGAAPRVKQVLAILRQTVFRIVCRPTTYWGDFLRDNWYLLPRKVYKGNFLTASVTSMMADTSSPLKLRHELPNDRWLK